MFHSDHCTNSLYVCITSPIVVVAAAAAKCV